MDVRIKQLLSHLDTRIEKFLFLAATFPIGTENRENRAAVIFSSNASSHRQTLFKLQISFSLLRWVLYLV